MGLTIKAAVGSIVGITVLMIIDPIMQAVSCYRLSKSFKADAVESINAAIFEQIFGE